MRRAIVLFVGLVAALAALIAAAGAWLLYTESGVVWSIARLQSAVPGLAMEGASGTWVRGVAIARVEYRSRDLDVTAEDLAVALSPWSLLRGHPRIAALEAERVTARLRDSGEPPAVPESLALPLDVDLAASHVKRLVVDRAGTRTDFADIRLSYAGGRSRHEIRSFEARHDAGALALRGTVDADRPYAVSGTATAKLHEPEPLAIEATLGGTLPDLALEARVAHRAATVQASARLTPFDAVAIARLRARSADVDLRAFDAALPRTRIAAEATLEPRDARWIGTLDLTNALAGPWDKALLPLARARTAFTLDGTRAALHDLRVELTGGGRLAGRAALEPERAQLDLAARRLDLRALHGRLRSTRLDGTIVLDATRERQIATAQLAQAGVALGFEAERRGDDVRIPRFTATSRGARAQGEGRIRLAGARPYAANVRLAAFDPSAWGDFPSGAIDGRFAVEGALGAEEVRVQYALGPSQLMGEALSGEGRFTYVSGRVQDVDARLAWARNAIAAKGGFGAPRDMLRLRIDAANLAALDARASGAVSGTATLTGTAKSPAVEIDLAARNLAYADYGRAASAALRGEARAGPELAFAAALRASGVHAGGWNGERLELRAEGREAAHVLALHARGGDVDLALDSRGRFERGAPGRPWQWSGTVERLRNAGAVDFALGAPAALGLGPRRVAVGPFSARLMGGDLHVAGFRYRDGLVESEGRFARLPVRPVAALAGVALGPRDTLRVSGRWSVRRDAALAIGFLVERDSGDLVAGGVQPLPLGLDVLRVEGELVQGRLQVKAALRSALATVQGQGSVATVAAGGLERITQGSAVRFSADVEVARLAALAPLLGSQFHLDGRARATLTGTGRLGAPVLTGSVDADRLSVALPPQGIDLRDGVLHARIESNRVEVRQFSIRGGEGTLTARGELAVAAVQRAALDWRADRLAVLARPDRRLVVSGAGSATFERGKLALSGRLRADAGRFQFGETRLPTLGPDVVVVGRPPPPEDATTLARTALDLTLDFGRDLHVSGYGLDAWIEGEVAVRTNAKGELRASGTVRTQRGTYTAFGQRLQIERGQLTFGGPLDNPGLDVVAMRKNQAVEAGVAVSGTVRAPLVRIVSDPPVPEGEALSWLVLGHGPADASRADLAMLPLAAAALFGPAKTGQGSIAQRLGVDTIALRSSGTLANQVVAVGKRFSDRLYVIYEQGIGATSTVLKIEYNLTRLFLLRAEAGPVSAAGLFFRYAFD